MSVPKDGGVTRGPQLVRKKVYTVGENAEMAALHTAQGQPLPRGLGTHSP